MPLNKIQQTALNYLARREYSRFELRKKLLQKRFNAVSIEQILDKLSLQGVLSDRRFSEAFIHNRLNKGYGSLRLIAELRKRGIDKEIIQEQLATVDTDTTERIEAIRRKKFTNALPTTLKERDKQIRYLQYCGFSLERILQTMPQIELN